MVALGKTGIFRAAGREAPPDAQRRFESGLRVGGLLLDCPWAMGCRRAVAMGVWCGLHFESGVFRSMRALFAISRTTVRSALRSNVFHVVLTFLLLAVAVLPLVIKTDHTALGHLQVGISYPLGIAGALLSVVTLWLSCVSVSRDIDGYHIHLITTKPVPRWVYWLGKWLGIVALQAVLLTVAATVLYLLVMWRLGSGEFPPDQMARLQREVLVGRQAYRPEPVAVEPLVEREVARRLSTGELPAGVGVDFLRTEVRRQVKAQLTGVPFRAVRRWQYRGLPRAQGDDAAFSLRYRMYVDRVNSKKQRLTDGVWMVREPATDTMVPRPSRAASGVHHELMLPARFVADDGGLELAYTNLDPGQQTVVFQEADGPLVMVPATGFAGNYVRVVVLLFLQIAFLALLGCVAGATVSTPVAIFLAFSYVAMGTLAMAMEPATPEDDFVPAQPALLVMYHVRQVVKHGLVSVGEFSEVSRLMRGELVDLRRMASVFVSPFLIHGVLFAGIGVWALSRREMGLVIRR